MVAVLIMMIMSQQGLLTIVSSVLALIKENNFTYKEILEAWIVGYEIIIGLGLSLDTVIMKKHAASTTWKLQQEVFKL